MNILSEAKRIRIQWRSPFLFCSVYVCVCVVIQSAHHAMRHIIYMNKKEELKNKKLNEWTIEERNHLSIYLKEKSNK